MEECDYCGESFGDEEALLAHLDAEHAGELGRIDRRRVEDFRGDDAPRDVGPYAIAFVVFISAAVVAYVVFGVNGGGGGSNAIPAPARTPGGGSVHQHGTMEMVVLGEEVDFSQAQYQVGATGNPHFHFENGNGRIWHAHTRGVTLQYALWTLDIGLTADGVTYDGTTYTDGEGYNVTVTVNGEPVDPASYVLEGVQDPNSAGEGDAVRIVVEEA